MSEELTTGPVQEVVSDPAAEPVARDPEDAALEVLDEEGEETPAEEELEEVEYEGKTYKVPKDLKAAVLRQSDYTRKAQEVAEARRALEDKQQRFQQAAVIQQQVQQEQQQLAFLQAKMEPYEGVDWGKFSEDDPVGAQRAFFEYTKLKDAASTAASLLTQKVQALVDEHRSMYDKLAQEGLKTLAREIKGWSPELVKELIEYGTGQGLEPAEVKGTLNPVHIKILDKARRYDQLMAKASERKPKPEPQGEPATVQGRSASVTSPNRMSTEQWMDWRNRQLARG